MAVISFMTFSWKLEGGAYSICTVPSSADFVEIKITVTSDQRSFGFSCEFRFFSAHTVPVVIRPVSKVSWSYRTMINLRVQERSFMYLTVSS